MQVREAGGAKAVERHTSRGKLLARQRIDQVNAQCVVCANLTLGEMCTGFCVGCLGRQEGQYITHQNMHPWTLDRMMISTKCTLPLRPCQARVLVAGHPPH
jgi:hypothetical protein